MGADDEPAGNHAHAIVKPARDSYNQLTQDFRPGLILFRPDGLALRILINSALPQAARIAR